MDSNLKEDVKLSVCRCHDPILRKARSATRKFIEVINEFSKVTGYKSNAPGNLAFIYTNNEKS